ncbi:MAG: glycosyltransferase [Actinobacteria bacterium]|nr:glycosyltransferase [Actinomycetota bacterium]
MQKIKVLQISKFFYPHFGGMEKVVRDINIGLKENVNMKVLTCQVKGKGNKEIIDGIEVFRAGSIGSYFSVPLSFTFPFLLKKLSRDRDILHFHLPFPLAVMSYLLVRPKGKVVVWWHSDILRPKYLYKLLYKPFLRKFLNKVDKIIVATPLHIKNSDIIKGFEQRCEVIPFGIDIERFNFTDEVREKAGKIRRKYSSKIILFVGRLIYYKGLEYLIQAMKNVDAKLLLIGEGYLKERLQRVVGELGIEDKVFFLGRVSDNEIIAYYHACDIFVLPSIAKTEAFGLVQLEAMACRKPIVNTNLPTGVPYVSQNKITGLTVPPKDAEALAGAINILFKDESLRKKYGENGKRRVEKEFTKKIMIEKTFNTYKKVLEN